MPTPNHPTAMTSLDHQARKELNETNDCTVIATVHVAQMHYSEAHRVCASVGRKPRKCCWWRRNAMQLPLFKPKSDWTPPSVSSLPSWKGARRVSVDLEGHDPDLQDLGPGARRNGFICGIGFAIEDGPAHYLPIRHSEDNLPLDQVLAYVRDQAREFEGDVVGANLSYDLDYLDVEGITFPKAKMRDVQIAAPLIYELHDSYSLQAIAERLGLSGKDETLLNEAAAMYGEPNAKKAMRVLPGRFVAPYAMQDVRLPLQILKLQEAELEKNSLGRIWNLECALLPVLVRMRSRGVRVSSDRLEEIEAWALVQEKQSLQEVHRLVGVSIPVGGVWQTKLVSLVLQKTGVQLERTPKGQVRTDAEFLERINHPATDALAWARKVNKLRTTFAASIRKHWVKGRIHCEFNQLAREGDDGLIRGARFGRMSCEHPNFQQQPARDEFSARWRSIYLPEEGMEWGSCDYSQQEPRMTTHYAVKAGCSRAQEAADRYRNDPLTDNHQMMADLTGLPRKQAKNIYLGLCYGMGGAKLANELGLPTKLIEVRERMIRVAGDEAQAILDKFNTEAPFVKELANKCADLARRRGYIITLLGRRCHFPKDAEGNYDWTHKALNRLIQGSSADQTKAAMVAVDAAGYYLQLQVHDELDGSVKNRAEAEGMAELMRQAAPLEVPSRVDVEVGPSWGEAK